MDTNMTGVMGMPTWWPQDILVGFFLFVLGVVGASIMVYLGEWERLLGKSARILEIEAEIASKRRIADQLKDPAEAEQRQTWEAMINEDEDRLDRERRMVRSQGLILYLVIGGVLAAILANSLLEAVAFGAGWTGLLGMFGIKKDSEERRRLRNEADDKELEEFNKTLAEKTQEAYNTGRSHGAEEIIEQLARIEHNMYNLKQQATGTWTRHTSQ
ncbi:MAG: hypothetical protein EFT35_01665 [Methanophagales archaeon ANME-1-THS]|nr:MAG: hypothetical protein EFT35_01665 [Methanophagales archaeon ANME-1-THS]